MGKEFTAKQISKVILEHELQEGHFTRKKILDLEPFINNFMNGHARVKVSDIQKWNAIIEKALEILETEPEQPNRPPKPIIQAEHPIIKVKAGTPENGYRLEHEAIPEKKKEIEDDEVVNIVRKLFEDFDERIKKIEKFMEAIKNA